MKKKLSVLLLAGTLALFVGCAKEGIRSNNLLETKKEIVEEDSRLSISLKELSEVQTNKNNLTDNEIGALEKRMNATDLSYNELMQTLKEFYSLNVKDVEKIFMSFGAKVYNSKEERSKMEIINKNVEQRISLLNELSTKQFNMPFHLAALKNRISLQQYFQGLTYYNEIEKSRECEEKSFPNDYGYRCSFRLTFCYHLDFQERIEGGGCQYVLRFDRHIKSWNTASAQAIVMIFAHGHEGRLHANNRALFIDIGTASAFGFEPVSLMASVHAVKR